MAIKFTGKLPAEEKWGSIPKTEPTSPPPPMNTPNKGISFSLPRVNQSKKPQPRIANPLQPSVPSPREAPGVNFLDKLPRELRDIIYGYILDDDTTVGNFGNLKPRPQKKKKKTHTNASNHENRLRSLLLINHQAHAELAPILYRASHFTFNLGNKVNIATFANKGYLWEISEYLKETLMECSLKFEPVCQVTEGEEKRVTIIES